MSHGYDDHLLIPGESTDGYQDDDGNWVPGSEGDPKYDGDCDAQETTSGGLQVTTSDTDVKTSTADLKIFLKDEDKAQDLKADDTGTLTRFGNEYQVIITNVRLIDGMVEANTI